MKLHEINYITDRNLVEDLIIPIMIRSTLTSIIERTDSKEGYNSDIYQWIEEAINEPLNKLVPKKRQAVENRLQSVSHAILFYLMKNQFVTRKSIILFLEYAKILNHIGAIHIPEETSYYEAIFNLNEIFYDQFYNRVENAEIVEKSSLKHVKKVHDIIQKQGYFLNYKL